MSWQPAGQRPDPPAPPPPPGTYPPGGHPPSYPGPAPGQIATSSDKAMAVALWLVAGLCFPALAILLLQGATFGLDPSAPPPPPADSARGIAESVVYGVGFIGMAVTFVSACVTLGLMIAVFSTRERKLVKLASRFAGLSVAIVLFVAVGRLALG